MPAMNEQPHFEVRRLHNHAGTSCLCEVCKTQRMVIGLASATTAGSG